MSDVLFRDESDRVASKFKPSRGGIKTRSPKERGSSSEEEHWINGTSPAKSRINSRPGREDKFLDNLEEHTSPDQSYSDVASLPRLLSPTLETIAIHFLLDDYLRSSHFQYLPSLYSTCHASSTLDLVLKAVAFSGLYQRSNRPELFSQSCSYYTKGLTALNTALQNPTLATADETLATVLLLALYSTFNPASSPTTLKTWQTHTRGALALLSLRGTSQLSTTPGKAMFTQASKMVMMCCIRRRTRIPESLRTLMHDSTSRADNPFQVRTTLHGGSFFEDFVALHADTANGVLTEPWDVISQAETLLERLEALMLSLPGREQYYRISSRPGGAGAGPWSPYLAQVWANAWMAQLGLNEVAGRQCQALGLSEELYKLDAVRAAEDIVEAVDQLFPQPPVTDGGNLSPSAASGRRATSTPDPAAGFFSIWPLFNAGSSWCVDGVLRAKVVAKLEYIGELMSLPQARKAAETLAVGCGTDDWMHMYHVF